MKYCLLRNLRISLSGDSPEIWFSLCHSFVSQLLQNFPTEFVASFKCYFFKFSALLLLVDLRFGKQQCLLYCMEHNWLPCQFQWRLEDLTHSYSSRGTDCTFVINDHHNQSHGAVPFCLDQGFNDIGNAFVFAADNLIDFATIREKKPLARGKSRLWKNLALLLLDETVAPGYFVPFTPPEPFWLIIRRSAYEAFWLDNLEFYCWTSMVTKRSCFCSYWPALWPLTNSFDASTERTVNPFNALRHRPSFKVFKQTPLDGPNCREASKS